MHKITFYFLLLLSICFHFQPSHASDLTWQQAQLDGGGLLTIQYKLNEPFLIANDSLWIEGMEYDMMIGFQHYLLNHYGVVLKYEWVERQSLVEIFERIQTINKPGEIGLDIISWTADREKNVKFSEPYFPDFQVLIANRSSPTVLQLGDFVQSYNHHTAITVAGTTYEKNLQEIKSSAGLDFEIKYIEKSTEIVQHVIRTPGSFGYIDLTRYLLALDNNLPVKRLNAYAVKGHGLGVIFNKNSDWEVPFNEYLASQEFDRIRDRGLDKYFGPDFQAFIDNLEDHKNEEVVLLMQEKKFMDEEIDNQMIQVEKQTRLRNVLLLSVGMVLMVSFFLYNRYKIKSKANQELTAQRQIIENQNVQLEENVKKLVELNEDKNSFIRILSHDLRAPINNINGISRILLSDAEDLKPDQSKLLLHVSDESKRLSDMVTRILDVEKMESETEEEFVRVDIHGVLSRVVTNFAPTAESKGISLRQDLVEGTFVMGLEEFFFHVFDNVLSNAIKFSPQGASIYVNSTVVENHVEVRIKDEGPGISKEDQKKMFKKFQMLSAKATAGEKSSGLGLSIVSKYIKLLDGQLTCESKVGEGTTFVIHFAAC
ncbi:ATP-binding protein [Reichenbachiella sp. 5M10]|uniref:ATP-binding protein n=1 Tax=Reichenbachiella sp. 5M10 TaxID=1889772 RepID=UPI00117B77D3|nr:ATP-binding protein [Reichenbachiella sp. 5M10]